MARTMATGRAVAAKGRVTVTAKGPQTAVAKKNAAMFCPVGEKAAEGACTLTRRVAATVAAAAMVALALTCGLLAAAPSPALAAGGVELEEVCFTTDDLGSVSPEPYRWYVSLLFSKNVAYATTGADDTFVEENLKKVHLVDANGNEVASSSAFTAGIREDRRVIYLSTEEWLDPLSEYRVVVDEGIAAANGEDFTTVSYETVFKTSDAMPDGIGLIQWTFIWLAIAAVLVGIVAQTVRKIRAR